MLQEQFSKLWCKGKHSERIQQILGSWFANGQVVQTMVYMEQPQAELKTGRMF